MNRLREIFKEDSSLPYPYQYQWEIDRVKKWLTEERPINPETPEEHYYQKCIDELLNKLAQYP